MDPGKSGYTKVLKIFAFANNHFSGYAPDTVKSFWNLWNARRVSEDAPSLVAGEPELV